jgi:diguanylate cyclase (GGDEF)-like protein
MSDADELALLRDAIRSFPEAVAVWSAEGRLIACSALYAALAPVRSEAEFETGDGRSLARAARALSGGGRVELLADVTALRRAEHAARFAAYHDQLTGLPNRRMLDDRLRQAIRLAQRRDRMVAALLVQLEDVRELDDAMLRELATRLGACVRKADTLARAANDQFVVVACDLKDAADCEVVREKVLQVLAPEMRGRVGMAAFPADGSDSETLLRNAEAALLRAKER